MLRGTGFRLLVIGNEEKEKEEEEEKKEERVRAFQFDENAR